MRTPSPSYCRLDLAPPLADRFIFGVAPIDYSPVLLLMPFGFHLAVDTLPSGNCKRWLQVRLGCVQLSPSCPFRLLHTFLSPGPRGITPAFGYGAPHPSARGTSTLLNNALLSAHYGAVRLLPGVRVRLVIIRLSGPICFRRHQGGLPVLVHIVSRRAWSLRLCRARPWLAIYRHLPVWPSR